MIGKPCFLLSLLQVGLTQEWKGNTPQELTAQEGSCVQILCHYTYPSYLQTHSRGGVWFNEERGRSSITFHSKDHKHEVPRFRHRTRLSGNLKDGDCSLIITNITWEDAGPYYFRIEFDNGPSYSYYPVTRLQVSAELSKEWEGNTPREVIAQEGSCIQIPCQYSYPSCLGNEPRVGIWFNNKKQSSSSIAFHSGDHNQEAPQFRHRTRLSGDLKNSDCSLIINKVRWEDAGPYFFRVEFDKKNNYNSQPVTQLRVSDFTDKPTIFPAEIIAGKRVNISCTFNTTCNGTAPVLTWDTPTDVPGLVSNTVTQHGVTLIYTSVLTLIPSLKHHGHNLTCRLKYPSVSSERILVLTMQYAPWNLRITYLHTINPSSINIIEGSSAVIICSVESFPASNLTWRHLNVTMNRTRSNNELWLVIFNVTSWHTGGYQCMAENEHGIVEGSITVQSQVSNQWNLGLLGGGILLCAGLSGLLILKCVRKESSTKRGHSAQAEQVSSYSPGEQSDRSWKRGNGKQEVKQNHRINEYQHSSFEDWEVPRALSHQKKEEGKILEMESNHSLNPDLEDSLYANCNFSGDAIYGNI